MTRPAAFRVQWMKHSGQVKTFLVRLSVSGKALSRIVDRALGLARHRRSQLMMSHERLDVYQCSIQFLKISNEVQAGMPRGSAILLDQLKRASISIPLNVAEGAGKRTKSDSRRYYSSARGSAMECAAIIDVCLSMELLSLEKSKEIKKLLERIVAMLTKMVM